jgi:hypothetical protein
MERGGGVVGSRRGAQMWGGVETGLSVVDSVFPGFGQFLRAASAVLSAGFKLWLTAVIKV